MILNAFGFLVLFIIYRKSGFHLREMVSALMLFHYTLALTMRRFKMGAFKAKNPEEESFTSPKELNRILCENDFR